MWLDVEKANFVFLSCQGKQRRVALACGWGEKWDLTPFCTLYFAAHVKRRERVSAEQASAVRWGGDGDGMRSVPLLFRRFHSLQHASNPPLGRQQKTDKTHRQQHYTERAKTRFSSQSCLSHARRLVSASLPSLHSSQFRIPTFQRGGTFANVETTVHVGVD